MLPLLASGETTDRTLFWRFQGQRQRAARQANWKYYRLGDHEFLYDLVVDPHERANRALAEADVLARFSQAWDEWSSGMIANDDLAGLCFDTADMAEPLDTGPGSNCK